MCLYVSPEVVLANLLSRKNGVSKKEIDLYCSRLKDEFLKKDEIGDVYINLNDNEMDNALSRYNKEFRHFQGRYFINENINLYQFNARYDDNVVSTFAEVAQTV